MAQVRQDMTQVTGPCRGGATSKSDTLPATWIPSYVRQREHCADPCGQCAMQELEHTATTLAAMDASNVRLRQAKDEYRGQVLSAPLSSNTLHSDQDFEPCAIVDRSI